MKTPLPSALPSAAPARHLVSGRAGAERRIAYRSIEGARPTVVWLGGYRSDMAGTKAEHLSSLAEREGFGFCRFDYSGHGDSGGRFEDGTISLWLEDAKAVIAAAGEGPLVLVGSSMGAWIALLLARDMRMRAPVAERRVAGLLLLAPAPDFTERLLRPALSAQQRHDLETKGFCTEPSAYSEEPDIYTSALIEDGARNLVMTGPIETGCPVHIIQGMADPDVPFSHALELVSHLPADGVALTLVPGGDHRLSRGEDLDRMARALRDLVEAARNA